MYCKLYNETEEYHTDYVLQAAIKGEWYISHMQCTGIESVVINQVQNF